jgi:predicted Zn-dependent protease
MKNQLLQKIALLLMFLIALPAPQMIVLAQQTTPNTSPQEKPQSESPEAKKLREAEEKQTKKEEERKKKEEKARVTEAKKYQTLNDFAADLYASDLDFRDQVEDTYLELQRQHANQAYIINTARQPEFLITENEGEDLKTRRFLYDNPRVQEYVNRLGQQIVPDDSEKLYSFKVILNPIPYAYTLSTGTILVSTGMVAQLDNEAQLAYVLAHELAHVYKDHWRIKVMMPLAEEEYNKKQEQKRRRWAAIAALAGAGVGAAVGDSKGATIGLFGGLVAGYAISSYYSKKIDLDWYTAQEDEADDFALKATLGKSFDIQEVPRLYATMAKIAKADNRTELGFLGSRARIRERIDYAQKMIAGSLQAQYQEGLKANKIKGTSPEFNLIMAELKRDNGIQAFQFDMLQMAKTNLQQAVMLRSDDPLATYYYGRVLKQVGRTKEELDLAQHSLLKAITLDVRHEIPEVQLHRALLLMDSKDNSTYPAAIAALQNYITDYGRKRATGNLNSGFQPSNLDVLYGYMRLLGEKTWTAPTRIELERMTLANTSTPGPQSAPRIEPASQTIPPTNNKRKP